MDPWKLCTLIPAMLAASWLWPREGPWVCPGGSVRAAFPPEQLKLSLWGDGPGQVTKGPASLSRDQTSTWHLCPLWNTEATRPHLRNKDQGISKSTIWRALLFSNCFIRAKVLSHPSFHQVLTTIKPALFFQCSTRTAPTAAKALRGRMCGGPNNNSRVW